MLDKIFETVISLSFMASIMIFIVLILKGILTLKKGHIKKIAFVAIWMMVFIRLSIPFNISLDYFQFSRVNPTQYVYEEVIPDSLTGVEEKTNEEFINTNNDEGYSQNVDVNNQNLIKSKDENFYNNNIKDIEASNFDIKNVIVKIWFSISLLLIIITIITYTVTLLRVRRLKCINYDKLEELKNRVKLKKKIKLKLSDGELDTAVYGILRPTIVVSMDNNDQFNHILLHELVHIKRYDNLKKLFIQIVVSFHWFNPLVWLSSFFVQKDIELACDEKVIALLGYNERKAYAQSIFDFANASKKTRVNSFSFFGKNSIKERIKNILILKKKTINKPIICIALVIFFIAGCMSNPIQQLTGKVLAYALEPNFVNLKIMENNNQNITDYYIDNDFVYYILSKNNNENNLGGFKLGKYNLVTGSNEIFFEEDNKQISAAGLQYSLGKIYFTLKDTGKKDNDIWSIMEYDLESNKQYEIIKPYEEERVEKNLTIDAAKGLSFGDIKLNGSNNYLTWHEIYKNTLGEIEDRLIIWSIKSEKIIDEIITNGNQDYSNILDGYIAYQKYAPNSKDTQIVRREISTGKETAIKNTLDGEAYSAYANENYFVYKEDFKKGAKIVVHKIDQNKDYFISNILEDKISGKNLELYKNGMWGINLIKDKLILTGSKNTIFEIDLQDFRVSVINEENNLETGFYQTKISENVAASLQYDMDVEGNPQNRLFYAKLKEKITK
ncbi:M56 family metallopeptidase [Anaerovorax odorimutans]|uniref:M56 family metallopeptidase n=1 Tax=Anaerovorax odorimutans TaxID=109327 RepID=UPI0003F4C97B|nr:M56 family metallopeptidase [Anaerovorax odorimutans]